MKSLVVSNAFLLLLLAGCDISGVIAPKQNSATSGPDLSAQSTDILSFRVLASDNPSLVADVTASVTGADIILRVPYKIYDQGIQLTPVISLPNGAQINTSGLKDFRQPVTYQVTSADGSATKSYTTTLQVLPETMSFLNVTQPFYVDAGGVKQTFSQLTLNRPKFDEIHLVVPSDVYDIVSTQPIGFDSYAFPRDAHFTLSELNRLVAGGVFPYNVQISSQDDSYAKTYKMILDRKQSSVAGLVTLRADVDQRVDDNTAWTYSDPTAFLSTAVTFYPKITNGAGPGINSVPKTLAAMASTTTAVAMGSNLSGNIDIFSPAPTFSASWVSWKTTGYTTSTSNANWGKYVSEGPSGNNYYINWANASRFWQWVDSQAITARGLDSVSLARNSAYLNTDISALYTQLTVTDKPKTTTSSTVVSSTVDIQPSSSTTLTLAVPAGYSQAQASNPLTFTQHYTATGAWWNSWGWTLHGNGEGPFNGSEGQGKSKAQTGSFSEVYYLTSTYNQLIDRQHTFTQKDPWVYVKKIYARKDQYATFANVITNSALVSNYTIAGDILTVTLNPYAAGTKQVGLIAVFDLVPETGTTTTIVLNLTN